MFGRGCFGNGTWFNFMPYGWKMVMMIGILILATMLITYAIKRKNSGNYTNIALEGLELQYVKGQISEEEFVKKRSLIAKK